MRRTAAGAFAPAARPAAATDLQARLRGIEEECSRLKASLAGEPEGPAKDAAGRLCGLVAYLALVVERHLATGEV